MVTTLPQYFKQQNYMTTQTKIALVTGGSRGLGKDMALSIARKGTDVILTYRANEAEANEVVKEIETAGRKRNYQYKAQ